MKWYMKYEYGENMYYLFNFCILYRLKFVFVEDICVLFKLKLLECFSYWYICEVGICWLGWLNR